MNAFSRACGSGYMRYPDKTNGTDNVLRYYGHIVPNKSPNNCITRTVTSDGNQFLTNSTCSMLDNASQENQYWQLEVQDFNVAWEDVSSVCLAVGSDKSLTLILLGGLYYRSPILRASKATSIISPPAQAPLPLLPYPRI